MSIVKDKNMKKKIIAIMLILMASVLYSTEYIHYGFSVKCAKCVEQHQKNAAIAIQIAYRTHEYKSENGKTYALYKCAGGHQYWAEIR